MASGGGTNIITTSPLLPSVEVGGAARIRRSQLLNTYLHTLPPTLPRPTSPPPAAPQHKLKKSEFGEVCWIEYSKGTR